MTPIIYAEPIHIPTPAWGALSAADTDALPKVGDWEDDEEDDEAAVASHRGSWPGWGAFALAVAAAVVHGIAIVTEAGKDYEGAETLAWVAIGISSAAVVVGITAAVLGRGRGAGISAAVVGVIANPWLLLQVLTVLQG